MAAPMDSAAGPTPAAVGVGPAPAAGEPPDAAGLQADVFKKLYPEMYYARFLQAGVRPDGRALGGCRPCSIGVASIASADGSALVKLGSSSALVGVKLDIVRPAESSPARGEVVFNVDLAPFATANFRPGRPPEWVASISHRLNLTMLGNTTPSLYSSAAAPRVDGQVAGGGAATSSSSSSSGSGILDLAQLCITEGTAAWRANVDVYILDADGSVFDVVLLAAVTALASTRLPPVVLTKDGGARRARQGGSGGEDASSQHPAAVLDGGGQSAASGIAGAGAAGPDRQGSGTAGHRLQLQAVPLSFTSGLVQPGAFVLSDPTAEEEEVASSTVTIVMDAAHQLQGLFKVGGDGAATPQLIRQCIEAAKIRYKDVFALLQQALAQDQDTVT